MKRIFMQRKGLETMVYDFMKIEGLSREAAIKEVNDLIKLAAPNAELIILDEFSASRSEPKR